MSPTALLVAVLGSGLLSGSIVALLSGRLQVRRDVAAVEQRLLDERRERLRVLLEPLVEAGYEIQLALATGMTKDLENAHAIGRNAFNRVRAKLLLEVGGMDLLQAFDRIGQTTTNLLPLNLERDNRERRGLDAQSQIHAVAQVRALVDEANSQFGQLAVLRLENMTKAVGSDSTGFLDRMLRKIGV